MVRKLTEKQEQFCQQYVMLQGSASDAYRRVYDCKNMKMETINNSAHKLMKNGEIAARIEALKQPIREKFALTVDNIAGELRKLLEYAVKPSRKNGNNPKDPELARRVAMDMAKLGGLLRNTDDPIAATYVRMENVVIDGKPHNWGVGRKPKPKV